MMKKSEFCVTFGLRATQDPLFDVSDGVIFLEKYCDVCTKKLK